MEEELEKISDEEPLDLDGAFDDEIDLNDEGMESLEEHFENYTDDEDDDSLEDHDSEY